MTGHRTGYDASPTTFRPVPIGKSYKSCRDFLRQGLPLETVADRFSSLVRPPRTSPRAPGSASGACLFSLKTLMMRYDNQRGDMNDDKAGTCKCNENYQPTLPQEITSTLTFRKASKQSWKSTSRPPQTESKQDQVCHMCVYESFRALERILLTFACPGIIKQQKVFRASCKASIK